ncbi:MAG: FtsX-like permease family protein, partial [Lachnospiraceae bacterium]|nr:FtsX-like permease family protein [Lachnospiraceae bacterium]
MGSTDKTRVNHQVFGQLASKNVRKSSRDYLVYFLTLTIAVSLFYSFNSLKAQFKMIGLSDHMNYLSFAVGVIGVVSVFICAVMGFLVVYANYFMLRRRKREIGIYLTLGMSRKDIGTLLMREMILIGTGSLIGGIVLGIFMSQGLAMMTAKLTGQSLEGFHPVFSFAAVILSILFFGLIFVFVHFLNRKEINKLQLIDLFQAEKRNEISQIDKRKTLL